jgi:hypothetical protein
VTHAGISQCRLFTTWVPGGLAASWLTQEPGLLSPPLLPLTKTTCNNDQKNMCVSSQLSKHLFKPGTWLCFMNNRKEFPALFSALLGVHSKGRIAGTLETKKTHSYGSFARAICHLFISL